jgi:AbiV family abortive infection protein
MKKFLNLSPLQSKGLDKPIYKNALNLKRDAILIAEKRKSYSSATSLLILSTEECVKSILVLLHSEKYKIYQLKDARKFFYDHVIRHQIAMFIIVGLGILESLYKYVKRIPTKISRTGVKWIDNFINGFIDFSKAADPFLKTKPDIEYLQDFNDIKNKGFYLDYRDKLKAPQSEVVYSDYNKTLKITNKIFKFNKLLRILFHEKLENHIEKEKIEEAKKYIKEFIDDGMKVVSFDELKVKQVL